MDVRSTLLFGRELPRLLQTCWLTLVESVLIQALTTMSSLLFGLKWVLPYTRQLVARLSRGRFLCFLLLFLPSN
ncbi:hypothetical protein BDV41DRAFT_548754 [Aspergillus transmontanensis]|uniref:Uncharacterized protein n=1 Tax=Aspergillus transmontanensis TaxID=1034304 RepID=A0A5N6VKT0_9EURO|nr:hypothetical protein BDV41DRAFT_548754 [Aspergillus transmontanensis]